MPLEIIIIQHSHIGSRVFNPTEYRTDCLFMEVPERFVTGAPTPSIWPKEGTLLLILRALCERSELARFPSGVRPLS